MDYFRSVCLCRGLGWGFVYLIPRWVVLLSDRYMYKLSEPWEKQILCCSFPSRITSTRLTNTINECKLRFFVCFGSRVCHILRDSCILLCSWHLCYVWATVSLSVLVIESVKLTLLRRVVHEAEVDTGQTRVCHWPFIQLFPAFFGVRSNWVHTLQLLNKFNIVIKPGGNSSGIYKQFESFNWNSFQLWISLFKPIEKAN